MMDGGWRKKATIEMALMMHALLNINGRRHDDR